MAKPVGLDELYDAVLRLARGSAGGEGESEPGAVPKPRSTAPKLNS
jgi:hypothetical protein